MQKSVIFVKKNVKINTWKIKNIVKLEIIVIMIIVIMSNGIVIVINLKYSVPKKLWWLFYIKKVSRRMQKQFTCFLENTEKYITVTVPIETEVTWNDTNGEELKKIHLTYYKLLILQDLWQSLHQILSIIFLKKFIELNINRGMMIKKVKFLELNISFATVFLKIKTVKV